MISDITLGSLIVIGCLQVFSLKRNKEALIQMRIFNSNIKELNNNTKDLKNNIKYCIDISRDNLEAINNIPQVVRVASKEEIRNMGYVKLKL